LYKGGAATLIIVDFISSTKKSATTDSYRVIFSTSEAIKLQGRTGAVNSDKFATATSYIVVNIWYRIKVIRTLSGEFAVYIKGGSFGNEYILVSTAGGSGTNPVTDNTYTLTNYLLIDNDVGDLIRIL